MLRAAALAVLFSAGAAPAGDDDALRGVPAEATIVVVADHPRLLIEAVRALPAVTAAQDLAAVKDAFAAPQVKRFLRLIEYYERDLGAAWPELLDAVAGKGITIATRAGDDPAPAVAILRGTDAAVSGQFVKLVVAALEDEVARQAGGGPAVKHRTAKYEGNEMIHLGGEFHLARVGATITVSNNEKALKLSLDSAAGRTKRVAPSGPAAARKLVGGTPAAWLWADLKAVKSTPAAKDFFANSKKEIVGTLVFGSTIDAVGRADFVAGGLYVSGGDLTLKVRLPAPRSGLPPEFALHAPKGAGPGSLPLLDPPGTFYSQSFYLDLATLWTDRAKLFNPVALKDFEKFVADVSKVLPGDGFGKLLEMSGPHHRVVFVAPPTGPLYPSTPAPARPGAAIVSSMRDRQFGQTAAAALRAGAAVASFTTGLAMTEETVDGVPVVTYRFPENKPAAFDPAGDRFHAAPAFAVVGDFLVVASRPDVLRALIPELKKPTGTGFPAVWRGRISGPGLAAYLRNHPESLVADVVLRQGITLAAAKTQVAELAAALEKAGPVTLDLDHQADAYELKFTVDGQ